MSNVQFRPVRGTEASILNAPIREGRVYFATDSGKMFMDKDNSRIPIGGGTSGIHFGNKIHIEPPSDSQIEFEFSVYEIESNEPGSQQVKYPNPDDLILNITDGCFYRVLSIDKETEMIHAGRLTIAGSGGGSGGGGTSENKGKTDITNTTLNGNVTRNGTILYGNQCIIGFDMKAVDASGAPTGNGRYKLLVNNVEKMTGIVRQGANTIDITELMVNEVNTVKVYIYSDIGAENDDVQNRTWTINTTRLALTWDYDETEANNLADSKYTFKFTVSGSVEKTVHIKIGNYNPITKTFKSAAEQTVDIVPTEYFQHGAVPVEMYVTADLDGTPVKTPSVIKQMIFYDENNTNPIISCGLKSYDLQQYDTVQIPIVLYSVENILGNSKITLKEEGIPVDTWEEVENNKQYYWAYTPTGSGIKNLMIQSGSTELTLTVNIVPLDIEVEEIGGYAFKFKANEFPSNAAIQNWNSNNVTVSFSDNFDWENGGLKTEKLANGTTRQSVVVKAGTSMTINYKLFEKEAQLKGKNFKMIYKTTGCYDYDATFLNCKNTKYIVGLESAVTLKDILEQPIQYSLKALLDENLNVILENPQDAVFDLSVEGNADLFDTSYIKFNDKIYYCSIIEKENAESLEDKYTISWKPAVAEENGVGLLMTAQTATIRSSGTKTTIPYCEDNYMEFEFDIWPDNGKTNFIQGWLDGVPCSIAVYPSGKDFLQDPQMPITIGSPDCDVVVYLVKVYESHLSEEGHLANFIADAPNATEMLARFKRNDILNEQGEISPEKLAKANPNCTVHLYDVDRIPLTKKDYVLVHEYTQYLGSDQARLHATNALYKVQGTSSSKYVVAAANLDTNFKPKDKHYTEAGYPVYKPTFTDGDGNDLLSQGGWSMDDQAIPCTFFCTKVNVASCEQANNAINQEWYNQYQPYVSSVRRKTREDGKLHRDTMQFKQGVIFMKDRNKTVNSDTNTKNNVFREVDGYVSNPWYKMYSIGSMGNSKDNTHIFHDEDNPLECCVENGDNQLPGQWMTVPQGGYEVDGSFTAVDVVVDDIVANKDTKIMCPDGNERTAWDLWLAGMDEVYGFRYPDGLEDVFGENNENEENGTKMVKAWYDFVSWMAKNNPSPKYQLITFKDATEYNDYTSPLYIRNLDSDGKVLNHVLVNKESENYDSNTKYYAETPHVFGYTEEPLAEPKTFDAYTFKNTEYTRTLAGTKVSTYAGTYTHDTHEYRMAKMLSECEDHLVMDSVVYHYLFIERHTMIDNVAKNTFWSSADLIHWDLTRDYDNDTADGNDNQGKLTLTYGYEIGDERNNVSVFNAPNSVWLNFIKDLYPVRQAMYQKLDTDGGVWDDAAYLAKFDEWQSIVPERCWIEDYKRKYIRPFTEYGDSMYFGMLEGGQKRHQRKQYENYQNIFVDSEYFGKKTNGSGILMRCNQVNDKISFSQIKIPIKVYSDCYIWGAFGSGTTNPNIKSRVKRGSTAYISSPVDNLTDATAYLFPARSFQQIGSELSGESGLEQFGLKQFSVADAPKLSKVVLGTYGSGISNDLLEEIGFEGNPLLRELYVCGYNADKSIELNLGNATGLQVLDARNSSMFSVFTFANGAPVRDIKLDAPVGLKMYNLSQLENLIINRYDRLASIDLDNIDNEFGQHSKTIFQNMTVQGTSTYILKNINWTLNGLTEIEGSSGEPIALIDKTKLSNYPGTGYRVTSLTGNVLVNHQNNYDAAKQYEIYNKYAVNEGLTELNIKFNPTELYTVEIYDGNNSPMWSKKIIKNNNVNNEFLASGPNGAFDISKITRASSQQYTYEFTKTWEVYDIDTNTKLPITIDATTTDGIPTWSQVTQNLRFVPIFKEEIRMYTLTFVLNGDNEDYVTSYEVAYGTTRDFFIPAEVPYKNDSSLSLNETYSFVGFALMKNSSTPISADYYVQNNQTFYPLFEQVNVYDNIHPEYFNCVGFQEYIDKDNTSYNLYGVQLALNSYVHGKITIPANFIGPDGNSYPVVSVNKSFRAYQNTNDTIPAFGVYLTHVFFENGSQIRKFNDYAFAGDDAVNAANNENETFSIQHIEYPNSLRVIGNSCFRRTRLNHYNIGNNSGTLWHIGNSAYRNAFGEGHRIEELKIASTVKRIDGAAFRALLNDTGTIDLITVGTAENPSLLSFATSKADNEGGGTYIFHANPDVAISNLNMYLQNNDIEAAGGQNKFIDPQANINAISIQP